jgi:hypothetical protein
MPVNSNMYIRCRLIGSLAPIPREVKPGASVNEHFEHDTEHQSPCARVQGSH